MDLAQKGRYRRLDLLELSRRVIVILVVGVGVAVAVGFVGEVEAARCGTVLEHLLVPDVLAPLRLVPESCITRCIA